MTRKVAGLRYSCFPPMVPNPFVLKGPVYKLLYSPPSLATPGGHLRPSSKRRLDCFMC